MYILIQLKKKRRETMSKEKVITLTDHMGVEVDILLEEVFEEISNEDLIQEVKNRGLIKGSEVSND